MKKNWIFSVCALVILVGCGHAEQGDVPADVLVPSITKSPVFSGVLRSEDHGRSFVPINGPENAEVLANKNILSLAVNYFDSDIIYAGTARNGMYISRDGGLQWSKVNFAPSQIRVIALNPQEPKSIYVSAAWEGRAQVFRSDDEGVSWRSIYIESTEETAITTIAFGPNDPRTIYIGTTKNQKGFATLARSYDGGGTWDNVLTQKATIDHVAFDADDVNTIYIGGTTFEIQKTRDAGETWTDLRKLKRDKKSQLYFRGRLQSFVAHPRVRGVVYAGTDQGFYTSEDYGLSWEELDIIGTSKGLPIRAVAVDPHDQKRLIYAAAQVVYGQTGEGWAITDTQSKRTVSSLAYDPLRPGRVYMTFVAVK